MAEPSSSGPPGHKNILDATQRLTIDDLAGTPGSASELSAGEHSPGGESQAQNFLTHSTTKVYYQKDDETIPFMTEVHVPPELITLQDVKRVLPHNNFKFYAMTHDADLGSDVKLELRDDLQILPKSSNGRFLLFLQTTEGGSSHGGSDQGSLIGSNRGHQQHRIVPGPAPTYHGHQKYHHYDSSMYSTESESTFSGIPPAYGKAPMGQRYHNPQYYPSQAAEKYQITSEMTTAPPRRGRPTSDHQQPTSSSFLKDLLLTEARRQKNDTGRSRVSQIVHRMEKAFSPEPPERVPPLAEPESMSIDEPDDALNLGRKPENSPKKPAKKRAITSTKYLHSIFQRPEKSGESCEAETKPASKIIGLTGPLAKPVLIFRRKSEKSEIFDEDGWGVGKSEKSNFLSFENWGLGPRRKSDKSVNSNTSESGSDRRWWHRGKKDKSLLSIPSTVDLLPSRAGSMKRSEPIDFEALKLKKRQSESSVISSRQLSWTDSPRLRRGRSHQQVTPIDAPPPNAKEVKLGRRLLDQLKPKKSITPGNSGTASTVTSGYSDPTVPTVTVSGWRQKNSGDSGATVSASAQDPGNSRNSGTTGAISGRDRADFAFFGTPVPTVTHSGRDPVNSKNSGATVPSKSSDSSHEKAKEKPKKPGKKPKKLENINTKLTLNVDSEASVSPNYAKIDLATTPGFLEKSGAVADFGDNFEQFRRERSSTQAQACLSPSKSTRKLLGLPEKEGEKTQKTLIEGLRQTTKLASALPSAQATVAEAKIRRRGAGGRKHEPELALRPLSPLNGNSPTPSIVIRRATPEAVRHRNPDSFLRKFGIQVDGPGADTVASDLGKSTLSIPSIVEPGEEEEEEEGTVVSGESSGAYRNRHPASFGLQRSPGERATVVDGQTATVSQRNPADSTVPQASFVPQRSPGERNTVSGQKGTGHTVTPENPASGFLRKTHDTAEEASISREFQSLRKLARNRATVPRVGEPTVSPDSQETDDLQYLHQILRKSNSERRRRVQGPRPLSRTMTQVEANLLPPLYEEDQQVEGGQERAKRGKRYMGSHTTHCGKTEAPDASPRRHLIGFLHRTSHLSLTSELSADASFYLIGHRGGRKFDPESTIGSESDARVFSDDDDRGSTTTDFTSVSRQAENMRRRRKQRVNYRRPSRASSFSSITESSMSLDVVTVTLNMDTVNFLGISIVGQSSTRGDNGIYVANIMKGGAVAIDGRIEAGDMILQVNDVAFDNFTNDQAVDVLRDAVARKGPIRLTVAKSFDGGQKSCFTVPRHQLMDEPVRPIDTQAWIRHTNAMCGMPSIVEGSEGAPTPIPGDYPGGIRPGSSSTVTSGSQPGQGTVVHALRLDTNTDKKRVVEAMVMRGSGLDIKDRTWLKIPVPNAFLGKELLDWLLEHVEGLRERRDARRYAMELLNEKLIAHVVNKCTFTEQCYYVSGYASMPVSPFPVLPRGAGPDLHSQASGGSGSGGSGSDHRRNRGQPLPPAPARLDELPQDMAASRQSFRQAMNQPCEFFVDKI
ncbi:unnamed protein product, partial [Mesorhabditis spiculigera]